MYHFIRKTFPNGLRVLLVPSKESSSIQVTVLVNTGSDFESQKLNGISHFIEHMCFNGTKKRPNNLAIAQELDSQGGYYNAFTSQEMTGFYVRLAKDKWELALDIISDIYINSQFPVPEIQKERGVILEEKHMYEDEPASIISDYWLQLLYGNQPAGRPIIGSARNIRRFQRKNFLEYHDLHYRAQSTVLIISGNFQKRTMERAIKKYFASILKGKGRNKYVVKETQKKPQIKWKKKDVQQTHLILGFRTFNIFSKKKPILTVINALLTGGMSSRLWQVIRENQGAAYYLQGFSELFTDHGFWAVKTGIDNNRIEQVIKTILREIQRLREELVGTKEIRKAKDYLRGTTSLQLEDVHDYASFLANQELLQHKIQSLNEVLKNIDRVDSQAIRKTARSLFVPQNLNLAIITPSSERRRINYLMNKFYQ